MTLVYSLSIECGPERTSADAIVRHFESSNVALASEVSPWFRDVHFDAEGWWVLVHCRRLAFRGEPSPEEHQRIVKATQALYLHLKSAPRFRYALAGIEVDEFRRRSRLDQDLVTMDFSGVVVDETIWTELGKPTNFVPFAPGYYWRPSRTA